MTRSIALSVLALALCVSCAGNAVSPDAPAPPWPPAHRGHRVHRGRRGADAHRAPGRRPVGGHPVIAGISYGPYPRGAGAGRPSLVGGAGGGPADHRAALEHAAGLRERPPRTRSAHHPRRGAAARRHARRVDLLTRSSTRRRSRPPSRSRTRTGAGGRGERRERDAGLLVRAPLAARGPHRLHPRGPRRDRAAGDHGRRLQLLEQRSYAVADEVDFLPRTPTRCGTSNSSTTPCRGPRASSPPSKRRTRR